MLIKVKCSYCSISFDRDNKYVRENSKCFCSKKCSSMYYNYIGQKCENCDNKTHRQSKFCRQCYLNSVKNVRKCEKCSVNTVSGRGKFCSTCSDRRKKNGGFDCKISDVMYDKHHKSSSYAFIRTRARAIAEKLGWNSCKICGYTKHVEICHIKPISSYDKETLVSIVNDISNLIPLCPNCHWEFDNGLLQL